MPFGWEKSIYEEEPVVIEGNLVFFEEEKIAFEDGWIAFEGKWMLFEEEKIAFGSTDRLNLEKLSK